jgi:transcriptional regulator with XRE-family HTH domain
MKFGDLVKSKRLELGKSLRRFCEEHDYDPGNHSKLERGILKPPKDVKVLRKLALALDIKDNSEEMDQFIDLAHLENESIPDYVLSDEEAYKMLPVFFRTSTGKKVPKEQLNQLIKLIKST